MSEYNNETATLTLSLDVIYHLIEDDIYDNYMRVLFDSSHKYVIIYSSNCDLNTKHQPAHVKHRRFTDWINSNKCEWELIHKIDNKFSLANNVCDGSFADFYIYGKDCDLR